MKILVDRCVGPSPANCLRSHGHEVLEFRQLGPDPGDKALLERATSEARIPVMLDTDFGELVYLRRFQ